jgi:hypothetical protein
VKQKKFLRYFLYFLGFFLVLFLAFVAVTYAVIFREVRNTCNSAVKTYQTNCIDSLVKVLDAPDKSIKEKNDAIWALGQIADRRSLPALKKLYTGQIPEREPLDKVISQYEIKKAIHWTENGNWTGWMYFAYR